MNAREMLEKYDWELTRQDTDKYKTMEYTKNDGGCITELLFNGVFKKLQISEYEEYNDNNPQGHTSFHIEELNKLRKN